MTALDIAFNSLKKAQNWEEAKTRFPGLENAILEGLRSENAKNGESAPKAAQSSATEQVEAQNPNMTWRRALMGRGAAHDPARAQKDAQAAFSPPNTVGVLGRAKDAFQERIVNPVKDTLTRPRDPVAPQESEEDDDFDYFNFDPNVKWDGMFDAKPPAPPKSKPKAHSISPYA